MPMIPEFDSPEKESEWVEKFKDSLDWTVYVMNETKAAFVGDIAWEALGSGWLRVIHNMAVDCAYEASAKVDKSLKKEEQPEG